MNGIFLLLGSNMGDRLVYLQTSKSHLQDKKLTLINQSKIYETEPWGDVNQEWYLNMVLEMGFSGTPEELLKICLDTEKIMGRERGEKWGERIIDIDILYFNNCVSNIGKLILPHPQIHHRRFTLLPLCDLCPDEYHPLLNCTQAYLLESCQDESLCRCPNRQI